MNARRWIAILLAAGATLLLHACTRAPAPPPPPPHLLLAFSRQPGDLYRWDPATSAIDEEWREGKAINDIDYCVKPPPEAATVKILIAVGEMILAPVPGGKNSEIVARFETKVDSVRRLTDGRLLVLQHPSGNPREREGPHRVRILDAVGHQVSGCDWEVSPFAYDIYVQEKSRQVVVTSIFGPEFEWCDLQRGGPFEKISLTAPDGATPENQHAVVRNMVFDPDGRHAWFIESAVGGDKEATALWRWDRESRRCERYALKSRGYFQAGMLVLGENHLLINGYDRLLELTVQGERVIESILPLPEGLYYCMVAGPAGDEIYLVGTEGQQGEAAMKGKIVLVKTDPVRPTDRYLHYVFPHPIDRVAVAPR